MFSFSAWLVVKWVVLAGVSAGFVWWARRRQTLLPVAALAVLLVVTVVFYDLRLNQAVKDASDAERLAAAAVAVNPVRAVFAPDPRNPEATKGPSPITTEGALDLLKQRHENVWVYYYLLDGCKRTQPGDEAVLKKAMDAELARASAPPAMASGILSAAKGTVEALYGRISCATLPKTTVDAYAGYIEQLKKVPGK